MASQQERLHRTHATLCTWLSCRAIRRIFRRLCVAGLRTGPRALACFVVSEALVSTAMPVGGWLAFSPTAAAFSRWERFTSPMTDPEISELPD